MPQSVRLVPLGVALMLAVLAAVNDAHAQLVPPFTVTATHDAVDASPGDGICADTTGVCTLRAAVMEANALPGIDGVIVEAGTYTLTLAGRDEDAAATGDLDITDGFLIYGKGAGNTIIDGAGLDRVFDVDPSAVGLTAGINSLTIQHGATLPTSLDDKGGGVLNRGRTNLFFTLVTDNEAGLGGGIFNSGGMGVVSAEIKSNRSVAPSSGAGGGVYNEGSLWIQGGTVQSNFAKSQGGGIYSTGEFTLSDSTVAGNRTETGDDERGGGIDSSGVLRMERSTINGNSSTSGGGIHSSGIADFTNSTISGNVGGGLLNGVSPDSASATLTNVTIDQNELGGISNLGTTGLKNTIVADGCSGNITSLGHNLDSDGSCGLSGTGDISNVDPLLGPLADNGHLFPELPHNYTHALLLGSPAIDAGDNSGCPVNDQRSIERPLDGDGDGTAVCDIGAFELQTAIPVPTTQPGTLPSTGGAPGDTSMVLPVVIAGTLSATAFIASAVASCRSWMRRD